MNCCPTCGQTLPEKRLLKGTHLTPYQKRIYEVVQRAGVNGIQTDDLFDKIYEHKEDGGPLTGRNSLYTIIAALNRKLKRHELRVRAAPNGHRDAWSYILERSS